jgi:hypothetical protein
MEDTGKAKESNDKITRLNLAHNLAKITLPDKNT